MVDKYIVRYGTTRNISEFNVRNSEIYSRDADVIVRSQRGIEWGKVLCPASEKTDKFLKKEEFEGRILRRVSDNDRHTMETVRENELSEFEGCQKMVAERKLQMQLVDVEHIFGGERLIFYYLAENRVDFRELVKALAKNFKTRIEMRQIGVRDEAKLLADYGDCGKPVCCNTFLEEMPPVSMKMAKLQKASLDPAKISGRCGRLKCCLRYEYDTYNEYRRDLPNVGAVVVTKTGEAKVIGQEILAKKVFVEYSDRRRIMLEEADILTVVKNSGSKNNKKQPSKSE
jgi:cell fate regulator YaaT (PSP1 superfamily)